MSISNWRDGIPVINVLTDLHETLTQAGYSSEDARAHIIHWVNKWESATTTTELCEKAWEGLHVKPY